MAEAEKIDTFLEAYDEVGTIAYYLAFNEDHLEHMDYVHQIVDALKEVKAQGQVCFGSLEGDNKGRFWGYYFDKVCTAN